MKGSPEDIAPTAIFPFLLQFVQNSLSYRDLIRRRRSSQISLKMDKIS